MSEIKLTVQDAVEQLLMSQSTIYSWIDKGFLKVEDTPAGRVIVISENELELIRQRNLKSKRNKVSKQMTNKPSNDLSANVVDAEVFNNSEEILSNMNISGNNDILKLISDLATKAGKYELIEDIQKQKQDDIEFWRNEYLKINSEYSRLQYENAQLIKENAEQKELIKKLKKPFGRFFH